MDKRLVQTNEDKGPMFFLVYEMTRGVWGSRAYWSVGAANRRAAALKIAGRMAFVEAR